MRADAELEALWDEFHAVVTMTSRELRDWLLTQEAGADAEAPAGGGPATAMGWRVVEILGKRKVDLNDDDLPVMREVVDTVRAERGPDPEPTAGDTDWRHRLMNLGHDPLRPSRAVGPDGRTSG